MAKRKKEPEAHEGLEEQEAPRKTRRQQQAAAAAEAQQQQRPVRSTRSRSSKQQQVQQDEDLDVQAQQHGQGEQQQQNEQQQQQQGDQLDDFQQDAELADSIQGLLQQSEVNPVLLLRPNADMADATRRAAKALLQYTIASSATAKAASQADGQQQQQQQQQDSAAALFQQLHTGEGFDAEQVWLQLEMHLQPLEKRTGKLLRQLETAAAAAGDGPQLLDAEVAANLDKLLQEGSGDGSEDDEGLGSSDDSEGLGTDDDDDEMGGLGDEGLESDAEGADAGAAAGQLQQRKQKSKHKQPPAVEDRFLKLDDMEAFLQQAEKEAAADDDDDEGDDEDEDDSSADEDDVIPGSRRQQRLQDEEAGMGSEDEEAMLDQLLDSTAALAGKQRGAAAAAGGSKKGKKGADLDAIMYEDFFGADGGDSDADMGGPAGDDSGGDWSEGEGDEGEEGEEEDEDEGDGRRQKQQQQRQQQNGGVLWDDEDDGGEGGSDEEREPLSTHERRLLRMQERIAELESEAMGERPWQLKGEVAAAQRPINSALEVDMDYENLSRPPPAPTEEATQSLEDMIKRRIAEARFDDVVRVLPPAPEVKRKQLLDLDDSKAQQGLGEVYEAEYVKAATGFSAPDKQDTIRQQASALFKVLCAKLDALSSFTYTPKPVVTELEVRSDVAALALEEVAPLAVSTAALAAPSEVFTAAAPGGEGKAEQELSREERKRRRAKKKRVHKTQEAAKESAAAAAAAAAGQAGALVGRKSLAKQLAAATSSGLIKKGVVGASGGAGDKSHKSSAMFGKLAAEASAGVGGKGGAGPKKPEAKKLKSSAVKL